MAHPDVENDKKAIRRLRKQRDKKFIESSININYVTLNRRELKNFKGYLAQFIQALDCISNIPLQL